jgi:hypothetical protein
MSTNQVPSLSISDWWNFASGGDTAVAASLNEYLLDGRAGPLSQDEPAPSLREPESKRA